MVSSGGSLLVTRDALERSLAKVQALATDARGGVHGPGSKVWELHREAVLLLGGGRAALLQLAHPFVAHGVDQHSDTRRDVAGRFQRTFFNVFAMTFGELDQAFAAARRVHTIHTRVHGVITEDVGAFARGTPYAANDVDALLWVFATLMHTVVQVVERLIRPLRALERDAYYQDSKRFAYLFGIPDERLPSDWPAFDAYVQSMLASEVICVGEPARQMARFLFTPPKRSQAVLMQWGQAMTASLLPQRLRRQYGLRYGAAERAMVATSTAALRPMLRVLPRSARYLPAYLRAVHRLGGRPPGPFTELADRALGFAVSGYRAPIPTATR